MEVLGYRFSNSKEEDFVKELVSIFNVRFVDQEIAEKVIDIRKQCRIKLPDAIIAATANTDDLCLVTRNADSLRLIHPANYDWLIAGNESTNSLTSP